MKMDEEWPDHFEERSRPSRGEVEEAGERKLDAMANMIARPQSLQDYLRDQLGWFEIEPDLRAMCERIIYNLDTNGYLQGRLEDLLGLDADEGRSSPWPSGPWPWCRSSTRPAWPPAISRNACSCNLTPGMPFFEQLQTLITSHLEDLEHNRLPVISRRTGYSIELIQQALAELRKLNPKPGADFNNVAGPARHARRVRRTGRGRQVHRFAWKTAARRASSSALITASCSPPGR